MKRIIYTLLISILAFPSINAQSSKAATQVVTDMVNVLANNPIQTNFGLLVQEAATKNKHMMNGVFLMHGNKFMLDTKEMKVYFDGTTQWAYSPSINEVTISNPTEKELSETNPVALIQAYQSKSIIRFAKGNKGRSVHLVELVPKNKNSDFRSIIVKVSKATKYPLHIQMTDKKGNLSAISLTQFRTGIATNAKTFTFDAGVYKDIEINDLR
ncbi:MAG TPA: outer membrane lipoprotein carrier protein LolA [Bacteroidales bacterium]|nr:outer membrane lipoprotein carrier protein LolA [Bacteroidales bacterium]